MATDRASDVPDRTASRRLISVGHGTLDADELSALLLGANIGTLLDVRTAPGSRRSPHLGRDAMSEWLPAAGVSYRWVQALGGFRKTGPNSPNVALRNASFRGYADYMRTAPFLDALEELVGMLPPPGPASVPGQAGSSAQIDAPRAPGHPAQVCVMCAETVWWRCHRRLIADAVTLLRGTEVLHLMHDGSLRPHRLTDGVRVDGSLLCYDAGMQRLPSES